MPLVGMIGLGALALVAALWLAAEALVRWADSQDLRDECERRAEDEEYRI